MPVTLILCLVSFILTSVVHAAMGPLETISAVGSFMAGGAAVATVLLAVVQWIVSRTGRAESVIKSIEEVRHELSEVSEALQLAESRFNGHSSAIGYRLDGIEKAVNKIDIVIATRVVGISTMERHIAIDDARRSSGGGSGDGTASGGSDDAKPQGKPGLGPPGLP